MQTNRDIGTLYSGSKDTPIPESLYASPRTICLLFLAFLAVGAAVHYYGFRSPMIYDSSAWILGKSHIFARDDPTQIIGLAPGRPLLMLTLYLNYVIGGMNPFFYRVVNSVILGLSGLILTLLAMIVLEIPGLRVGGTIRQKRLAATFLGFVFVVHPLQTCVVLYIWQRAAIMACLFYFASLAVYLALRTGRVQQPIPAYILVQILFLGAMLSKENAATLPFVLLLAEITLFRQGVRQLAKRMVTIALIALPPLILYMLALRLLHSPESPTPPGVLTRLISYYQMTGMSPLQVFMTECRVLFAYLSMIVSPGLFEVQLVKAEVVSTSFWKPPTTPFAVMGVVGLLGLGLGTVRRIPLLAFGILFYLITSVPEAYLIPKYLFAGYRPILPMAGVLMVLVWAAMGAVSWSEARVWRPGFKPALCAVGFLILLLLSTQTVLQARNWNPHHFWRETYRRLPELSEQVEVIPYLDTLLSYSSLMSASGDHAEAIAVLGKAGLGRSTMSGVPDGSRKDSEFDIVIARNPEKAAEALVNLGFALESSDDLAGALAAYRRAAKIDPRCGSAWYNLGQALDKSGRLSEAVRYYQKALEVDQGAAKAWYNMGLALKRMGKVRQAIRHYEQAINVDPQMGRAYNNLGLAWEESGSLSRALANYAKALELMPNNREVNFNFGNALMKNGDLDKAINRYAKALEIDPSYAKANANLGVALLRSGRFDEALISLRKALSGDPKNAGLHNTTGVALAELGRNHLAIDHFKQALSLDPKNAGAKLNLQRLTEKMETSSSTSASNTPGETAKPDRQ